MRAQIVFTLLSRSLRYRSNQLVSGMRGTTLQQQACAHTHTHTHTRMRIYTRMYVKFQTSPTVHCLHPNTHTPTHTQTQTHTHAHSHTHHASIVQCLQHKTLTHISTHTYIYTHTNQHTHTHTRKHTHTHIHAHTHTNKPVPTTVTRMSLGCVVVILVPSLIKPPREESSSLRSICNGS